VGLTVGEDPVDDHAEDREEEDDERPRNLVSDWAVGLEDFHDDKNIKNQDNEADDSSTSSVLPCVAMLSGLHGSSHGEREEGELEDDGEGLREHDCG